MSRQYFQSNKSLTASERIDEVANHIFGGESGLAVARIAMQSDDVDVVMGGYVFRGVGPSVFAVGLARHNDSGRVIYEQHVGQWRDIASSTAMYEATLVPTLDHRLSCIPNFSKQSCIRFDARPSANFVSIPRYTFGKNDPIDERQLPEDGRLSVARTMERFATGEYDYMLVASELQEALIALGGAATVFRDPAMRVAAGLIGEPG